MLSSKSLKSLVLYSIAGAGALLAAGCDRQSGKEAQPQASETAAQAPASPDKTADKLDRSHKGTPIPAVTVVDNTGESLDLTSLKGKPVLINLWATWCAPCIAEMPTLNELAGKSDSPLQILPISEDTADIGKVVEILHRRKLDHIEPWHDEHGDLGFQYGGNLPVSILFDSQGKEVWRFTGGNDWTSPEAQKLLAEAK
ncbi:thiol-disulfide isomerase/thioredoxin [Novosphingobium sp. PhB165]|uniref:TlpA family protein disulfide reductase n=1 Tax=Novosphingobium sp. PhB165 TaxID=2485105 RepID=UPI001049C147|nr:TlpA disulfide reductase family protein [Novosphingobium sp. PhB165]TCM17267.1 thiol-disulfide isomerase/thioredoxin [Novosphingobium sp. PhB165]